MSAACIELETKNTVDRVLEEVLGFFSQFRRLNELKTWYMFDNGQSRNLRNSWLLVVCSCSKENIIIYCEKHTTSDSRLKFMQKIKFSA